MRLTLLALIVSVAGLVWWSTRPVGRGAQAAITDSAGRPLQRIGLADVHPWGANFFLEREVEGWKRDQTVTLAREAGIRWAKQHLLWSEVEREPGVYDWSKYDDIVDRYVDAGIEVILRLDWAPQWAATDFDSGANSLPRDFDEYAGFVAETVRHFRGRVRFYQVWNEPNLMSEWGWQPVDAVDYVDMLARAARAARAADPDVVIMAAPLAINNEKLQVHGNQSDLEYLRAMYDAGAAPYFDVLAANGFGKERPPRDPPAPDILNLRRIELQRRIMVDAGDDHKPIWLSEYGWNAAPDWIEGNIWGRVSEEEQAAWTVEGVRFADDRWPWSGVFATWYFRRERFRREQADSYFQMMTVDFVARRIYDAVRTDATGRHRTVATTGYWQERSSPIQLERRTDWRWRHAPDATDGQVLVSAEPGASVLFRFSGTQLSARLRTGPQAASVVLSVDGRERAPISLKGERRWQDVVLASGLTEGEHRARLAVGRSGGELALDYIQVGAGARDDPQALWLPALAVLTGMLTTLLVADVWRAIRRVPL